MTVNRGLLGLLSGVMGWAIAPVTALGVELVGRAVLPVDTLAPGPPSGHLISGHTFGREIPFAGQPVQGISSVLPGPRPGTYWVLLDNGYGAKDNSADFALRIYGVEPDFATGQVFPVHLQTGDRLPSFTPESWVALRDPMGFSPVAAAPFPEWTHEPLDTPDGLTGAVFDPESMQRRADGSLWLGDEFGPFLLRVSATGELLQAPLSLPTPPGFGDHPSIQSPDHPALAGLPTDEARQAAATLPRSRGLEGLAINPQGTRLYPMLEGALASDPQRDRRFIFEFDLTTARFTSRIAAYRLEHPSHAIGDLAAINEHEFLVIERDGRQGDRRNPAFPDPAQFKRIYKIDLTTVDADGFVAKELVVDLLSIADPHSIGGDATLDGVFSFPFVTIESVLPLTPTTLLVINDNNYPLTAGRQMDHPDATEFILLRLDRPLRLHPVTP